MPMLFWIVPYIAAGGVMWFVANQMATIGREIPLGKAILAIMLLGGLGTACSFFLSPYIGYWYVLIEFFVSIFIVKEVFWFSFRQALFTVLIYWIVMIIATIILFYPEISRSIKSRPTTHSSIDNFVQEKIL
jgi:hypothetical protein